MFKNIPIKIVLVFFLIGIIIIGGFCGFFLNSLNIISQKIQVEQNLDIGQVTDMINQLENNTKSSSNNFFYCIYNSRNNYSSNSFKICYLSNYQAY